MEYLRVEARSWFKGFLITGVSPRKEATGKWLKGIERYAVFMQTRKEFRFYGALKGVVNSLISGRFDPAVLVANLANLGYFIRQIVADTKPLELSFLV